MAWYGDPELHDIVSAFEESVRRRLTLLDHVITPEIYVMDARSPPLLRGQPVGNRTRYHCATSRPVLGELIHRGGLRQSEAGGIIVGSGLLSPPIISP